MVFCEKDKFGFGIKVNWLHLGFSSYKPAGWNVPNASSSVNFDLRFLKVAPQATFGFNDDTGIDVYLDIAPTLLVGANGTENASYGYMRVRVFSSPQELAIVIKNLLPDSTSVWVQFP